MTLFAIYPLDHQDQPGPTALLWLQAPTKIDAIDKFLNEHQFPYNFYITEV